MTASEDAWLSADYNSARMDTELGNYAAVIDELAAYYGSELPVALRRRCTTCMNRPVWRGRRS